MKKFEKKRIVVKVGTSTLTHANTHKINIARMAKLVSVLADLHNMGHEVVLVSSGAIAVGTGSLDLKKNRRRTVNFRLPQLSVSVNLCFCMISCSANIM